MTDDEFRDLLERASAIEQLTRTEGWKYLVDRASVTVGARQRSILAGGFKSMDEYQKVVGWVQGAEFVLRINDFVQAEVDEERRARAEREAERRNG